MTPGGFQRKSVNTANLHHTSPTYSPNFWQFPVWWVPPRWGFLSGQLTLHVLTQFPLEPSSWHPWCPLARNSPQFPPRPRTKNHFSVCFENFSSWLNFKCLFLCWEGWWTVNPHTCSWCWQCSCQPLLHFFRSFLRCRLEEYCALYWKLTLLTCSCPWVAVSDSQLFKSSRILPGVVWAYCCTGVSSSEWALLCWPGHNVSSNARQL